MNREELDFATAQVILASLFGDKELTIRENPLETITQLCNQTKKVIEEYSRGGIPSDLPIKNIEPNVAMDIYAITAGKNWKRYMGEKKNSEKSRTERVEAIISRYNHDHPDGDAYEEYARRDLLKTTDQFIEELEELDNLSLKERLNEWIGYDLESVFDEVGVEKPRNVNDPEEIYQFIEGGDFGDIKLFFDQIEDNYIEDLDLSEIILRRKRGKDKNKIISYLLGRGMGVNGYDLSHPLPIDILLKSDELYDERLVKNLAFVGSKSKIIDKNLKTGLKGENLKSYKKVKRELKKMRWKDGMLPPVPGHIRL